MKKIILSALLLLCAVSLNAQQYFNKVWDRCNVKDAFFETSPVKNENGEYKVYGITNGERNILEGIYRTDDFKNGVLLFIKSNGDSTYLGTYANGLLNGKEMSWHPTGEKFTERNMKDGKFDGNAEYFFPNGQMSAKLLYSEGEIKNESYWNEDGSPMTKIKDANRHAEYPGGKDKFNEYVARSLIYPKNLRNLGIQGRVVLSFSVQKDGSLADIKVVKSAHPDLDKEAIRVIEKSKKWLPGKDFNQTFSERLVFPVTFRLGEPRPGGYSNNINKGSAESRISNTRKY
jgi:TonB family protein